MGIVKGTVLAGMGLAGWVLEETFGYLGAFIASSVGVDVPPEVAWMTACAAGIVIGDLLSVLVGDGVSLGRRAGIVKGLVASLGGLLGLFFAEGFVLFVASIWVPTVLLDLAGY